jgi:rhamnosyltransferase
MIVLNLNYYDRMDIKILAGIVLYNPELSRLEQNIKAIISQVDNLILIENGSKDIDYLSGIKDNFNIHILKNNSNSGIAYALNQIMEYANENDFKWVLTLDQDSVVADNLIATYKTIIGNNSIGMVTCRIDDRNFTLKQGTKTIEVEQVKICITSGAMVRTTAWSDVGGFDNFMFIDSVDFDFCLLLGEHNWKIIKTNNTSILHEVGKTKVVHIFGKEYLSFNHALFRYYYIIRNPIYVVRKHNKLFIKSFYKMLFIRFYIVVVYENNRKKKLINMFKGLIDGLTCKVKK